MKKAYKPEGAAILRQKAEELLKAKPINPSTHQPINLSESGMLKLIHELEVHQIELEMQNEELMRAKEQIEIVAEKYTELFDFAPSGYFSLSKEGVIIELNLSGAKMLGEARSRLKEKHFSFFVSRETKPVFNLFLEKSFISKATEACEVSLSPNGSLPIHVHLSGIVTENGKQCHVTMVNINDLKLLEEEIKLKNEQLEKTNAEKDKFFSIIAHDLRSPFNGFLGLTQVMAEELPDMTLNEIQKIAVNMRNSADNLYRLLENLLEWSIMQRGLVSFDTQLFLLMPVISESMVLALIAANKKEIKISYDIPEDLMVFADGKMLGGILRNLVSNAVKFTHRGGNITIAAKSMPDASVEISIKDTGIGMNKDIIDNLFRLDVNTRRKGTEGEPSTGLGLIICKDFIEKHGGKIGMESEEGKGSTFYFNIPQNKEGKS